MPPLFLKDNSMRLSKNEDCNFFECNGCPLFFVCYKEKNDL